MPTTEHVRWKPRFPEPEAADPAGSTATNLRRTWPLPERRLARRELAFVFRSLATLIANGLPLPEALETLARERSLRRHSPMLMAIQRRVAAGEPFSAALDQYPRAFDAVIIHQVEAAERAGTLAKSLERIADQVEHTNQVRAQIVRRFAYPILLVVVGSLAVTFMLVFVIPLFEEMYAEANVPLPLLTRLLIAAGRWAVSFGWILPLLMVAALAGYRELRKRPETALAIDRAILRLPVIGDWVRNLAVLRFVEIFANLLESGFRLVEALRESSDSIGNRAVHRSVQELEAAVTRGEPFGRELTRTGELFPPVVSQLIAVGERTGNLTQAATEIREHLWHEVRRQTDTLVGFIEPVLTILLAVTIAVILLAVYLPIFDMIGAVGDSP